MAEALIATMTPDRYLYHLRPRRPASAFAPPQPAPGPEGFVHTSFAPDVAGSHARHFKAAPDVEVLRIDPRRLDVPVRLDPTPRGPMPHVYGPVPADAVVGVSGMGAPGELPDRVQGAHFCFVAFRRMTLLDLVGALDPISRISSMGFARESTCEIVAANDDPGESLTGDDAPWSLGGATFTVTRTRPALDAFDVLVLPGGPGARALSEDGSFVRWLQTFPPNRLVATVCTGTLLLGATGRLRGRRANTHASALDALRSHGAIVTRDRVVDEGQIITAGGVTSSIDLGLHVVRRLHGEDVARAIAAQMEWLSPRV